MYTIKRFLDMPEVRGELSDPREAVDLYYDRVVLAVGGFTASSHFARLKDEVKISTGTHFWMTATIELPQDFYSRNQASFKMITCGDSIGTYRRIGLWIDSSQFPRLQSEVKGSGLKVLWRGAEKLPVGKHYYAVEFIPSSISVKALLRLYVDGKIWGESNVANYAGAEINRLVWGFDGAADQDTKKMSMTVWQVGLDDFEPVDPCIIKRERLSIATAHLQSTLLSLDSAKAQLQVLQKNYDEAKAEFDAAAGEMNEC